MSQQNSVNAVDRVVFFDDFPFDAGATLTLPWTVTDVSAAGAPTNDFVADQANGVFRLTLAADNELETLALTFGDHLMIDPTLNPRFKARVHLNHDGAGTQFSADQRVAIGLCSTYNATWDSVAEHAWFRIEGANNNVLIEGDDGTSDIDDIDSGLDYSDSTWHTYEVFIDADQTAWFTFDGQPAGSTATTALASTNLMQPIIAIQKDAGTEAPALTVDYVQVTWDRV